MDASKEPLLRVGEREMARARSSFACCAGLRRWWAASTNFEYLTSAVSRRWLWKHYWYIVVIVLLADVFCIWIGAERVEPDAIFFYGIQGVVAVLASRLPKGTVRSDFSLMAWQVLNFVAGMAIPDAELSTWGYWYLMLMVFVFHAAGVHPSAIAGFSVSGLLCCLSSLEVDGMMVVQTVVLLGLVTTVMTVLEWSLAVYFVDLQEQLRATKNLLDGVTHGHCAISREGGVITSASDKMGQLLRRDLRGERLASFALEGEREVVETMCNSACQEPVMVTFAWSPTGAAGGGTQEFEVRLVPYQVTVTDLYIALQVVGEMRMMGGAAAHTAEPESAEVEEPAGDAVRVEGYAGEEGEDAQGTRSALRVGGLDPALLQRIEEDRRQAQNTGSEQPGEQEGGGTEMWITFDTGHPRWVIQDLSPELLPEQGQLLDWVPEAHRNDLERWVITAVNLADEDGDCPGELRNVEFWLPPRPPTKVKAARVWVRTEPPEMLPEGNTTVPGVLCLSGVTITERSLPISHLLEVESVTMSESASAVASRFQAYPQRAGR